MILFREIIDYEGIKLTFFKKKIYSQLWERRVHHSVMPVISFLKQVLSNMSENGHHSNFLNRVFPVLQMHRKLLVYTSFFSDKRMTEITFYFCVQSTHNNSSNLSQLMLLPPKRNFLLGFFWQLHFPSYIWKNIYR